MRLLLAPDFVEERQWQLEEAETRFREMLAESDEKGSIVIVKDGAKWGHCCFSSIGDG